MSNKGGRKSVMPAATKRKLQSDVCETAKDNASANRADSMPASKKLKLNRRVVHETIQQDEMLSTPKVIFYIPK